MKNILILLAGMAAIAFSVLAQNLSDRPMQEIRGAKVETENQARLIAFAKYMEKRGGSVDAREAVSEVTAITLGYEIPGFAAAGEQLWEARIVIRFKDLRSILWINPKTERVFFVIGPWDVKKAE
jgi:hypothetical protein